jgi:hypothetical protein
MLPSSISLSSGRSIRAAFGMTNRGIVVCGKPAGESHFVPYILSPASPSPGTI